MLEVEGLEAGYGDKSIVRGVSFTVQKREIVTIIGHNGAGKSTILKAIFNMIAWRRGQIRFRGQSLLEQAPFRILAGGLSYIPQNHSVFPRLTIAENLRMGGYVLGHGPELKQRIDGVLERFPLLSSRLEQLAGNLSGGEQRILEIARTLLLDPALIMLDEPSIGLAPRLVEQIFAIVRDLREQGKAILMVEQNVRKALESSDRGIVLEQGEIKLEDRAAQLVGDPRVARLYLGA
jgi:branched-chain amino acid transport system ATP-binding protein